MQTHVAITSSVYLRNNTLKEQQKHFGSGPNIFPALAKKSPESSPSFKPVSNLPTVEQVPKANSSMKFWEWMHFETSWHDLVTRMCLSFCLILASHAYLAGCAWAGLCARSQQTCKHSCSCQPRCDSRVSVQFHCLLLFGDIQGKKNLMGTEASRGNEVAEMVK